jgi:hypothetical protein
MKAQLQALIDRAGFLHYSRSLARDEKLLAWVIGETADQSSDMELKERVYICLNGDSEAYCSHGSRKPFYSIKEGYTRCKRGCPCVSERKSNSAKSMNARLAAEGRVSQITENRRKTNLEKYGVENVAQLESVQEKMEKTSLANWGTRRPTQNSEIKERLHNTQIANHNAKDKK